VSERAVTITDMTISAVLLALFALLLGIGVGWRLARAQLRELFGAQAAEALHRNGESLAALAESRLGQREQAVDALVAPLTESLARVQQQLTEVERGRASSDAALREQVLDMRAASESLRTQTSALVTALRAPQVRGRWGEMQLERVVEAAGMAEHVDYETQVSSRDGEGTLQRPDLVVRVAGGKNIVVDAKVAFGAYLEALEAPDEPTRDARMKAHARQLRTHVDALGAKSYWRQFSPTPEFVVCFVPADQFLDAALRADPALFEYAFSRDVVLATPSTLVALLRTVAYGMRQEKLADNAARVHELGTLLYTRLATLGEHVSRLGKSLGTSVEAYNAAVGSLERRVLVTAREMSELGVATAGKCIDGLEPLGDALPRLVTAPELTQRGTSSGRVHQHPPSAGG
jgi:DNA recombination protein RmuC